MAAPLKPWWSATAHPRYGSNSPCVSHSGEWTKKAHASSLRTLLPTLLQLERVCGAHNANPEEPSIQPVYGEKTIVGKPVHITLSRPTASGGNPGFELQYEVTEAGTWDVCVTASPLCGAPLCWR